MRGQLLLLFAYFDYYSSYRNIISEKHSLKWNKTFNHTNLELKRSTISNSWWTFSFYLYKARVQNPLIFVDGYTIFLVVVCILRDNYALHDMNMKIIFTFIQLKKIICFSMTLVKFVYLENVIVMIICCSINSMYVNITIH